MMRFENYIKNKQVKHFIFKGVEIFVKNSITNNISAKSVINKAFQMLPRQMLINLDTIYIGDFDFLRKREVQAMYENSSIFVTNIQDSEEDMIDDIIHEVAHSIEEIHGRDIYSDGKLEREFLNKREKLWTLLDRKGLDVDLDDFLETSFSYEFLYKKVGYPVLASLTANLFYSPYAATSLREYYANAFEAFFLKQDVDRLKKISPIAYKKIIELTVVEDK